MSASRYKDTKVYDDGTGRYTQGPWQLPPEFAVIGDDWATHTIRQNEVGFMDILAVRYFGTGREGYGWIIAHVNGIIDCETDMVPGNTLRIPPRALVDSFERRVSYARA